MVAALLCIVAAQPVTTRSLLQDLLNLDRLAVAPAVAYRTVQASSHDRRSLVPGTEDWFANEDFGNYLRTEVNEGREELVLADWEGPGAMVKVWSANPMGTLRLYFDGETEPRITEDLGQLLRGETENWPSPFGYVSSRGSNLVFPFPFQRSLKVTVSPNEEGEPLDRMYYTLAARLYDPGTSVESFTMEDFVTAWVDHAARTMADPPRRHEGLRHVTEQAALAAGESMTVLAEDGPGAVREVTVSVSSHEVWREAFERAEFPTVPRGFSPPLPSLGRDKTAPRYDEDLARVAAQLSVEVDVDGVTTVRAPLVGFMGAGVWPSTYRTLISESDPTLMTSRLVMPFAKSVRLTIRNHGTREVRIMGQMGVGEPVAGEPWALHAAYGKDFGPSRPMRDMAIARLSGPGRYVGTVLHVQNPVTAWWGEGDEKIWVDGEAFPSWFGTGTEDYFGYAWCDPTPFSAPTHAQPHSEPPTNAGQVANLRWHVLDDILFQKSLRFDLEMWHWAETNSRYASTALWYAPLGSSAVPEIDPTDLALIETPGPVREPGAQEAEEMPRRFTREGSVTDQSGFPGLSNGLQVWWVGPDERSRLQLLVLVQSSGRYRVRGRFCFAPDYGSHRMTLAGQTLGTVDFYRAELGWEVLEFEPVWLKEGWATLQVTPMPPNPEAKPGRMFGLDCVWLEPVP